VDGAANASNKQDRIALWMIEGKSNYGRNPMQMQFEQFTESAVDGRDVVEIVLFRKLDTKLYREMPLLLNAKGEKVLGQSWPGYWWRIAEYQRVIAN
jgi:hypothetical protein